VRRDGANAARTMTDPAYELTHGDSLACYEGWEAPDCIISDGPYGLGLYPGEPASVDALEAAYEPHVRAWSRLAKSSTTLWLWIGDLGWAKLHALLERHGWLFERCHIWDKGPSHCTHKVNGRTRRRFPLVSELCVFYSRAPEVRLKNGRRVLAQAWLRAEWKRAGLKFRQANEACGVKTSIARNYLCKDGRWMFPQGAVVRKLAAYAAAHGDARGRPYFSLDGARTIRAEEWDALRYQWNFEYGVTNVWNVPPLRGVERLKLGHSPVHINQKPLALMHRILGACTKPGDVVWEPFGGLCSASVAALELGRRPFAAELLAEFAGVARERLERACGNTSGEEPAAERAKRKRPRTFALLGGPVWARRARKHARK